MDASGNKTSIDTYDSDFTLDEIVEQSEQHMKELHDTYNPAELGKIFMGNNVIELELSQMVEDHLTEEQRDRLDTLWQEMASIIELGLLEYVKEM